MTIADKSFILHKNNNHLLSKNENILLFLHSLIGVFLICIYRDLKTPQGENFFMSCVSELVLETREVRY